MMFRRLLVAACTLAALLTPAVASAAPTPAPADFYGSNIQAMVRVGFVPPQRWGQFLQAGDSAGLTTARFDAAWAWAEPKAPGKDGVHHYDWRLLDGIATVLANHGMRWMPVVDEVPDWAKEPGDGLPESQYPAFAAFAAAFAARYGSNGVFWLAHPEVPRIPVTDAEVWTEANSTHFWVSDIDPAKYLGLFKVVRDAIKSADPSIQVIVSLGWQNFEDFTSKLYDAGLAGQSDGVGFHPYAPTARGVMVLTRKLHDVLTAHGEPDLPIYMTEVGWPKAPDGWTPAPRSYDGPVSDQTRAATASLAADAAAASDCNVKSYVFYSLVEQQKDPTNIEDWLGLYNPDGSPTATLQALAASAHRWATGWGSNIRSGKTPLLPLCHGPTSAKATASNTIKMNGRLPIQLQVPVPATQPCMVMQTSYYGNPLEDASVFVRTARGRQTGQVTGSAGQARICLSAESRRRPFLVWARSGGLAASRVMSCRGKRCYPLYCTKAKLSVKPTKPVHRRMKITLSVKCGRRILFGEPIRITAIDYKGNPIKLAAFFTREKTQTVAVRLPAKPRLRAVKVKFQGDKAFMLEARVRAISLRQ